MKKTSDAQIKAIKKYDAKNTTRLMLKLNLKTDAEIIQRLNEVGNKQGYIKKLIQEDIRGK